MIKARYIDRNISNYYPKTSFVYLNGIGTILRPSKRGKADQERIT